MNSLMFSPLPAESRYAVDPADLRAILSAWQEATTRLEQTHQILRAEVRRLTEELEVKNRELARKNRLADLGQMAAHIAHEVRNTLVPVALYMSLLRRHLTADEAGGELVEKIAGGFNALEATVNDLLHFTVDRDPRAECFRPAAVVRETLAALNPQFAAQRIVVRDDLDDEYELSADPDMLRRAVLNVALNALDVLPAGGELTVTSVAYADGWELEMADNGPGWSDDALDRASEPFFTTKHHGTGLGLAIVERIMESHHGQLLFHNCPEGGAAVTLCFPQDCEAVAEGNDDLPGPRLLPYTRAEARGMGVNSQADDEFAYAAGKAAA